MGLDMYLRGNKYFMASRGPRPKDEEGYDIESIDIALGYWRKHADLHGYIVQTFAEGHDECQDITLSVDDLKQLRDVCSDPKRRLERTTGFFFGESANDAEQIREDCEIFDKAIAWLVSPAITGEGDDVWRSVIYRASW